jgi:hypothetical protein
MVSVGVLQSSTDTARPCRSRRRQQRYGASEGALATAVGRLVRRGRRPAGDSQSHCNFRPPPMPCALRCRTLQHVSKPLPNSVTSFLLLPRNHRTQPVRRAGLDRRNCLSRAAIKMPTCCGSKALRTLTGYRLHRDQILFRRICDCRRAPPPRSNPNRRSVVAAIAAPQRVAVVSSSLSRECAKYEPLGVAALAQDSLVS